MKYSTQKTMLINFDSGKAVRERRSLKILSSLEFFVWKVDVFRAALIFNPFCFFTDSPFFSASEERVTWWKLIRLDPSLSSIFKQ